MHKKGFRKTITQALGGAAVLIAAVAAYLQFTQHSGFAAPGKARRSQRRHPRQPTMTGSRRSSPRVGRGARPSVEVPDMTLEEHQRRGDAAAALFREIVRRATE